MKNKLANIFLILFSVIYPLALSAQTAKKVIAKADDVPLINYDAPENIGDLVVSDQAFQQFAVKVRADLETILRETDVQDKSIRSRFEATLAVLDFLNGKSDQTAERIGRIRKT